MSLHLEREFSKLKQLILTLSSLAERNYHKAIQAVKNNDHIQAKDVIDSDDEIDDMEIDVEEECLKILALHQPVAVDLRFIASMMKINNDLERIGDLAADIAESVIELSHESLNNILPEGFSELADKVGKMIKTSLDAMVNQDPKLAYRVCATDDDVDQRYEDVSRHLKEKIQENPHNLKDLLEILSIFSYLEQIGDHAKKIAEDVIYSVEGEIVRHRRSWNEPKL